MFQLLHVSINSLQFTRDIDLLRAVRCTLVAADAVAGLPQTRNAAVVAYEEGTTLAPVGGCAAALRRIAFTYTTVEMSEVGRDVDAVRMPF